jgi:hypothetical protein
MTVDDDVGAEEDALAEADATTPRVKLNPLSQLASGLNDDGVDRMNARIWANRHERAHHAAPIQNNASQGEFPAPAPLD